MKDRGKKKEIEIEKEKKRKKLCSFRLLLLHVIAYFSLQLVYSGNCHKEIHSQEIVIYWRDLGAEPRPYQPCSGNCNLLRIRYQLCRALKVCYISKSDAPLESWCPEMNSLWPSWMIPKVKKSFSESHSVTLLNLNFEQRSSLLYLRYCTEHTPMKPAHLYYN